MNYISSKIQIFIQLFIKKLIFIIMVQLSKFQPKDLKFKPIKDYAINQVPKIWGGYIALFEPHTAPIKTGFYTAYWFASKSGYWIKKALYIIPNV